MISVVLFLCALLGAVVHAKVRKESFPRTFLYYMMFFNVGVMGLLAFFAHLFMADATAAKNRLG